MSNSTEPTEAMARLADTVANSMRLDHHFVRVRVGDLRALLATHSTAVRVESAAEAPEVAIWGLYDKAEAGVDAVERVMACWIEIKEALNREFAEGIITYGELKAGVNNAAYIRDAAIGRDSVEQWETAAAITPSQSDNGEAALTATPRQESDVERLRKALTLIEDHQTSAACMTATEATERTLVEVQAIARCALATPKGEKS